MGWIYTGDGKGKIKTLATEVVGRKSDWSDWKGKLTKEDKEPKDKKGKPGKDDKGRG